jgi:putative nucleotidyltransferase with HDIG domain
MSNSQQPLSRLIRRARDLPTLPRTVLEITETINNPKSSAQDLAQVIATDQVLTARLLRLVNSSFYAFPRRISSVTNAIVLVGFDAIRHLMLSSSVFDVFHGPHGPAIDGIEQFWDHSLACAVGAKTIGNQMRYDRVEELFVAGLLHDIGKIVEMRFAADAFQDAVDLAQSEQLLIIAAEKRVFGFDHQEAGRMLAQRWNLSEMLASVISWHHEPMGAGPFVKEAAVVHLADILSRALRLGWAGDARIPSVDTAAWAALKLDTAAVEPLMADMARTFQEMKTVMRPNRNGEPS